VWVCRRGGESPFTFPHLIEQLVPVWVRVVGVAGWNISLLVRTVPVLTGAGLGTLLGPEETPACGWGFSWNHSWPGRPNARVFVVLCGGGCWWLGCGCVLSVA
jgi:hypothetical protein